jgi:adenosylmethionine-8-amino-7-oxononanoate aminotransferase
MEFGPGKGVDDAVQRDHGVIVRQIGPVVAMSPPLVITDDEVRRLEAAVRDVVSRVARNGQIEEARP